MESLNIFIKKQNSDDDLRVIAEAESLAKKGIGFVDTHSHIHFDSVKDRIAEITQLSKQLAVNKIISVAITLADSQKSINITKPYENVFCSVGTHPTNLLDEGFPPDDIHLYEQKMENYLHSLKTIADNKKVVAIGEVGLDYYHCPETAKLQNMYLADIFDVATDLDLPIIIHNRDTDKDMIKNIQQHIKKGKNIRGVLHSFTGGKDLMNTALDAGMYISFAGMITYKNADEIRDSAIGCPMDRLMIETDTPYLTPSPYRGKPNEPARVIYTAYTMSQIKNCTLEEIAIQTTQNAERLFKI